MSCAKIRGALPLYVGGDLSARRMRHIGLHLERCDACRAEFESYSRVRHELGSCSLPESTGTDESLADAVSRELVGVAPARRPRGRIVAVRVARAAAFAGIAITAGAFWWGGDASRDAGDDPSGRTASMPSDLSLRKLDESPPVGYVNPGRLAAETRGVERAERDDICIIAGPGIALRVAVPQRAPQLPMNPRPRVRPHGYQSTGRPLSSGFVTH